MCFVVFAYDCHRDYLLVLAANRDEFHRRPAAPAHFWGEFPDILAGKDLEQSGTWMGITRRGRFAALTNYRDPASHKPGAPSRGKLVIDYLKGSTDSFTYMKKLAESDVAYNGYNLLLMDEGLLWYYSNRAVSPFKISPGIHGLSNHRLDTPWPKVERGKATLSNILDSREISLVDSLFALLADRRQAKDQNLPQTGVGLQRERLLAPIFIENEGYGTRCSTVILIGRNGRVHFQERSFESDGRPTGDVACRFFTAPADLGENKRPVK